MVCFAHREQQAAVPSAITTAVKYEMRIIHRITTFSTLAQPWSSSAYYTQMRIIVEILRYVKRQDICRSMYTVGQ